MKFIFLMLGSGLIKKESREVGSKTNITEKRSRRIRKKVSVENFLREILGTHLIEKKF